MLHSMAWLSANLMDIITYVKCVSNLEHLEHRERAEQKEQKIGNGKAEQKIKNSKITFKFSHFIVQKHQKNK